MSLYKPGFVKYYRRVSIFAWVTRKIQLSSIDSKHLVGQVYLYLEVLDKKPA